MPESDWLPPSEGWMSTYEMRNLEALAKRGGQILEIGVWKGRSTSALTLGPGHVHCVDPFSGNTGEWWGTLGDTEQRFRENMARLGRKNFTVYRMTSDEFFAKLPAAVRYRTIVVDGLHSSPQVYYDLTHAWPHLEPKGWMFVDDVWRRTVRGDVARFRGEHPEAAFVPVRQPQDWLYKSAFLVKP